MLKKFFILISLLLICQCLYSSTLLQNIRLLKEKKERGEISSSEYQEMLNIILSSGKEKQSRPEINSSRSLIDFSNAVNAQVNIQITKYWRAKDLVNLSTNLTLKSLGRKFDGQVIAQKGNQIIIAFPVQLPAGHQRFQIIYNTNVRKSNQKHWRKKTFCKEFEASVSENSQISYVLEFIEQKDRDGDYAVIKLLNYNQYMALIKQRRKREKSQKALEKQFLNNLFGK